MVQSSITMTVEEASRYSGIGRNTLRQLIDWGLIPVMRIGRKILIRVETLDLFVEKNNGKDLRDRDSLIGIA